MAFNEGSAVMTANRARARVHGEAPRRSPCIFVVSVRWRLARSAAIKRRRRTSEGVRTKTSRLPGTTRRTSPTMHDRRGRSGAPRTALDLQRHACGRRNRGDPCDRRRASHLQTHPVLVRRLRRVQRRHHGKRPVLRQHGGRDLHCRKAVASNRPPWRPSPRSGSIFLVIGKTSDRGAPSADTLIPSSGPKGGGGAQTDCRTACCFHAACGRKPRDRLRNQLVVAEFVDETEKGIIRRLEEREPVLSALGHVRQHLDRTAEIRVGVPR